jgi:hypothetical protein
MRSLIPILTFVLVVVVSITSFARDSWCSGRVINAETMRRVYGSKITIIDAQSNEILGKGTDNPPEHDISIWGDACFSLSFDSSDKDSIDLKVITELKDFKTDTMRVVWPREFIGGYLGGSELPDTIWLVKKDCELDAKTLIKLHEVTVSATKIKMVMHGDTIVYNASAFNLSSGSMLDALIAQLPGTELSDNGQIKVNGEFVSSLLVDGKEFFSGNANVALRNLPAYTVKNVNVYHRDDSEGSDPLKAHKDKKELPLVMDVRLKPQYQKGFIGNVGVGYGTKNRYLARAFGMEYTRNGRIAGYAQTNNVNNDAAGPGSRSSAGWSDDQNTTGQRKIFKAGLDFNWTKGFMLSENSPKKSSLELTGNVLYTHSTVDEVSQTSRTLFMSDADKYANTSSASQRRSDNVDSHFQWQLRNITVNDSTWLRFSLAQGFSFNRNRYTSSLRSAEFGIKPDESKRGEVIDSVFGATGNDYGTRHDMIYRNTYSDLGLNRSYAAYSSLIVSTDSQRWRFFYNTAHIEWHYYYDTGFERSNREVKYNDPLSDIANYLQEGSFSRDMYIHPELQQQLWFRRYDRHGYGACLSFDEGYVYDHAKGNRRVYQLDNPFASLEDAIIDATNTYYSTTTNNEGYIKPEFYMLRGQSDMTVNAELRAVDTHLLYQRGDINADISRLRWKWSTNFRGKYEHAGKTAIHDYRLNVSANRSLPSLTNLLETTDNTNPLSVRIGNPQLKPSTTLNASASYTRTQQTKGNSAEFKLSHSYYWDRTSTYRGYNPATGVSTYQPVNVSGAYTLGADVDITRRLDRDNRLWLTSSTHVGYENIPDWMSIGDANAVLSKVRNTMASESVRINWSIVTGYTLTLGLNAGWRNATSPMEGFSTINVANVAPKLAAQCKLPWSLELGTDLTFYKRFGYSDESLNEANWVWNIGVQRPFCNGKLIAKVDAFDVLGQLSNISASINSLGRTETWTNSLHRYVMFSLAWNFSIMPHGGKTR